MPVPLAPYPTPPPPLAPPNGGQSQLVCSGCRNLLLYPQGAKSVCCAVCRAVTTVPPPGNLIFSPSPSSLSCTAHSERSGSLTGLLNDRFLLCNVHSEQMFEFAAGTEMAQLICGGCHTLLMYIRGASSVQCSCCHTVNLALEANQVAHVNCGNCQMLLMYQYGARSVKCAVCNFVTSIGASPSTEQKA